MAKFHPYMAVDLTDAMAHNFRMTIRVTGIRWWKFKSRVALVLMKAAGWLLGVPAEITFVSKDRDEQTGS